MRPQMLPLLRPLLRHFAVAALLLGATLAVSASAQSDAPVETSACYAFAQDERPPVWRAKLTEGLQEDEVAIRYIQHSTFLIETAKGVTVATDFAGYAGGGVVPRVVTMNGAHSTHYTDAPDPAIEHVLRGWPQDGAPADWDLTIEDLRIRNVTTDVVRFAGERWIDGNSIFVFEVADLCIGHLGHLHHVPSPEQYSKIGFLDVVMAPVDGVYTISQEQMIEILTNLRARLVIPMHYFGAGTLSRFVAGIQSHFEVQTADSGAFVISDRTLPRKPTVLIVPPYFAPRDD